MPASIRPATRCARATSRVHTRRPEPEPYVVGLGDRVRPRRSNGMTTATGPKISSCATRMSLSTSTSTSARRRSPRPAGARGRGRRRRPPRPPSSRRPSRRSRARAGAGARRSPAPAGCPSSDGSPIRIRARRGAAARRRTRRRSTRSTRMREPQMHVCPAATNAAKAAPATARSIPASANTITGALPPSSVVERANRCAAATRDRLADLGAAGEGHLRDASCSARAAPALAPVAGDDVDDAVRDARLLGDDRRARGSSAASARKA